MRRHHFVPEFDDAEIDLPEYGEKIIASMAVEARTKLAVDAMVSLHNTDVAFQDAIKETDVAFKAAKQDPTKLEEARELWRRCFVGLIKKSPRSDDFP